MDCGLDDLGYTGDLFTWRRGEICERLDRAVCNLAWENKFPRAAVINEEHVHSDHRPIVLDMDYLDEKVFNRPEGRVKQFEARWLREKTVTEIVKASWEKAKLAGIGPSLADRTRAVHAGLHTWDREILKGPKVRIRKLKKELERLRHGPLNTESRCRQKEIIVLIKNILDQEEIFWL
ncbi:hypothetical protein VPH35_066451 [Triticum aestivum]|uniref:Reverse transcriptase n=1 Tax=Triticum turgidum subsp. durum TaxID=4567 RepID=A0A9R0SD83_TRITD|nr:unnamed protein product [Triticum turgidum subsp. durum]